MDKQRIVLLYECNTGFTAIWKCGEGDAADFGTWVVAEMRAMADYSFGQGYKPDIHIEPMSIDQKFLDQLEVDSLLCHM